MMSPIKGISDVIRLPRLGKIYLGVKEDREGYPCPKPTDYFVCPDEVKAVVGEQPKELRIMLPTEDQEQWASQYYRCYSESRNLLCRGDGEIALAKVETSNSETGAIVSKLVEMPCTPYRCPAYQQRDCRRVMNLQFLLPDCPGFGVYQLDTSSRHSMYNINNALTLLRNICQRVSMIPLSLKLVEKTVQPGGFVKTAYILELTCPYSLAEIQKYAQIPTSQSLLLPPPDGEAPIDLFPQTKLICPEPSPTLTVHGSSLQDLWTKAKSKIYHADIQDYQITRWFEEKFQITVTLNDFDEVTPLAKITEKMLALFCDSVDRYSR